MPPHELLQHAVKICDLTQFYSPLSGGVKRYVQEKIAFIQSSRPKDEHVLVVPGVKSAVSSAERSRIYSVASPLISRSTQYRALLNLSALDEIIEREKPDLIESADPYQIGWKAIRLGRSHRVPVAAFYHSNFAEAHVRQATGRFGRQASNLAMRGARSYVRRLYNRFNVTLVPSHRLTELLKDWGVTNTRQVDLGVNPEVFHPAPDGANIRADLDFPDDRTLLLYVGRLATEKNTETLFKAFALLGIRSAAKFHLLVIGDGQQRTSLTKLQGSSDAVTWISYCADSSQLAQYYRAADLFVHPGVEETFGLAALESQACGTPVVGIRGSNMDAVILHDQSSWAHENSASALADAIKRICATNLRALGTDAAARAAAQYAWPRVFERLFSIYDTVVERYRGA